MPEKGSKPTKTGQAVQLLQSRLPKARVVYASATGASDCKNMGYMSRLGLWGCEGAPFRTLPEFTGFVGESGVTAMEVVALDLKWQGIFVARQLSFDGATFEIREVTLDEKLVETYDRSVGLWVKILKYVKWSKRVLSKKRDKYSMTLYWGAHQRFFKYLCIASKIDETVRIAKEAIKAGKSVVIGLQSTGEAQSNKLAEENDDFSKISSTAYGSLRDVIKSLPDINDLDRGYYDNDDEDEEIHHFEAYLPQTDSFKFKENGQVIEMSRLEYIEEMQNNYKEIHDELAALKRVLPPNSLDKLKCDLGGPSKVAEMTGRLTNTVCNAYGESDDDDGDTVSRKRYTVQKRTADEADKMNVEERNKFMNGSKKVKEKVSFFILAL